jgi:hypothetical protein
MILNLHLLLFYDIFQVNTHIHFYHYSFKPKLLTYILTNYVLINFQESHLNLVLCPKSNLFSFHLVLSNLTIIFIFNYFIIRLFILIILPIFGIFTKTI